MVGKNGHEGSIHWQSWEEQAFSQAKAEDKLILLDLTAIWCHACHVMDETTYRDPIIIKLLNQRFIPIKVDTDQRPDIEARYRNGGWPTTSILLPTGEILFQANLLEPEELREALLASEEMYREQKEDLVKHATAIWEKVAMAHTQRSPSEGKIHPDLIDQAIFSLEQHFDEVNGGFAEGAKFFEPDAIAVALRWGRGESDPTLMKMALTTLNQQQRLLDPVWSGFYRYAKQPDWSEPHYEKMLDIQALNISSYLEAYQVTGDLRYKEVVQGLIGYVTRFLFDPEQKGFLASQDADIQSPVDAPGHFVTGEDYFHFGEVEREGLGVPFVDRTIFTGWNGLMIRSYLRAYQVLGEDRNRTFALDTLDRLWEERYQEGKGMLHGGQDESAFGVQMLSDQVYLASALIEASITTGDKHYLEKAEVLVKDMLAHWEDPQAWGFFDKPHLITDYGLLRFPQKPLEENLQAVLLLCDLYYITGNSAYHQIAKRTLQFVLGAGQPPPIALLALAVDRYLTYPVHIVVVGDKERELTQRLYQSGLRLYAPGKVAKILDPSVDVLKVGEVSFPKRSDPTAYLCTDKLCSPTISDPDLMLGKLQ